MTYTKSKNGFFKWSFKDKGKTDETVQHTEIEAGGGLTFTTAEGVVVEYRETGNVKEDIAQLAQAPGLAWMGELLERDDIDWLAVQEVHNEWNKSDSGIGGPGMQLVSLVMAVALSLTPGGQGFATGVLGMAEGSAMTAAVAAGFNALVMQAGMQVVGNGGDIGAALEALASIDTVRILATAMLTAGLMKGLEKADFMKEYWASAKLAKDATSMDKFIANLAQKLKLNAVQAGVNTGVNTAIYGGDLGENLIANLRGAAVSAFGEVTANEIGHAYAKGDFNYVTHKVAHAALGGALAVANGEDVTSGALGGVVGEVTYEFVKDWTFDQLAELKNQKQITPQKLKEKTDELKKFAVAGVDIAKLSAGVVAAAVGGDIDTAADTAGNAAQNNGLVTGTLAVLGIIAIAGEVVDKGVMVYDLAMATYFAANGNTAAAMSHAKDLALACMTDGLPFNAAGIKAVKLLKKLGAGDLAAKFAAKFGISESSDFVRYANFSHVDELAKNGVKHNPEDILFTHKMPDGKVVFLEKGHSGGGLEHIIKRHTNDFSSKGIPESKIPDVIFEAMSNNNIVGKSGTRKVYAVEYGGSTKHIAIGVGSNGYVVTAHPVNNWK